MRNWHAAQRSSTELEGLRSAGSGRRRFVKRAGLAAMSSALLGYDLQRVFAEGPPETKKIRIVHDPAICLAPQYVAEELLRYEGFTEIEYVSEANDPDPSVLVATGKADFSLDAATALIPAIDAGHPLVLLAGFMVVAGS